MTRRDFLARCPVFLALTGAAILPAAAAQGQGQVEVEDLLGLGKRLLEDVVDPSALEAIRSGDPGRIQNWLGALTTELQGDHVLDLAALEDGAEQILPWLERSPATKGYASWLRARLDYFKVADYFRDTLPRPRRAPNQPEPPPMTPTPGQERKAWEKETGTRPEPKGASTWVPRLKPVFRGAGAPAELVWLAEVESSFDPQARSPAGAVGMYQLMPGTARDLGLATTPRDERLVPEKNAKAAATYLARMRRQFGDWQLALAAYNAGPGRVSETLKNRRAKSFDAIAPFLPAETQMYVPKFEAILKRREGRDLSALRSPGKA
ncbi:MAG: lytic transglycosylase domain-containing protein [Limisphaerales bacterium]